MQKSICQIKYIIVTFITVLAFDSYTQPIVRLSLKETIGLAQKNSLDYKIAKNMAKSSYWNFQAYKSEFLPKLSLNGSIPNYYRTINLITLPTGQNDFVSQNVANSSLNLNLSQNIGLTGGSISMSSSLQRIDNFGQFDNTSYNSVPFSLSYFQNNLFYNEFKWQKRIQPLRLLEAQREYLENLENISYLTTNKYFDLLSAQQQIKLDQQNLKNIDTLVKITQARFEIGTVQLNNVLQSKVSLLNAKQAVANSSLALETAKQNFMRFLNLNKIEDMELQLPDSVIFFTINPSLALEKAKSNRKFIVEFQRRRLEAEQAIAKIKSETGPTLNMRANLGLTQTGNSFNQTYADLLRNQSVTLAFYIPLLDWGVNRSNRKRAEANLELENNNIEQMEVSAEQEIYYQTMKWSMQREQMLISREVSSLAQQRYDISKQKYTVGSLSYTDFNNAQLDKDRAITDYMINLRNYWALYYLIRRLTLFDFESNKNIEFTDLAFD